MGYLLRPTYRVSASYTTMTLDTACGFWYIRTNKESTMSIPHFNKALRDARTTTDPNLLEILSHDPSVTIVLSVIGNLATTPATLRELSKHRDPEVRHAVLRELSVRDIEPLPENYISVYHALEAIYNDVEAFLNDDMDMDFNDLFAAIRDTASEVLH